LHVYFTLEANKHAVNKSMHEARERCEYRTVIKAHKDTENSSSHLARRGEAKPQQWR